MYTVKFRPQAIASPKAFGLRTEKPYFTRHVQLPKLKRRPRLSSQIDNLRPLMRCMAAPPTTPESSPVDDVEPLPSHEILEEGQVVQIDDKECIVFSPVDVNDRVGTIIFLSGFAQTPEAYGGLLERCASAGIVVLAPLTSTLAISRSQLQGDLVDDAAFWMEHAIDNSRSELEPYLPRGNAPIGILGHSVGGGLTYSLAARFPQVKAIVAMSPTPDLVEGFDAVEVIASERFQETKRRALVVSGGLDPYSRGSEVKSDIITPLIAAFGEDAVDHDVVPLGVHTMYQDYIDFPLEDIVADFWKEDQSRDAFLTAIQEFPGLLAGKLFLSGLRFELGLAVMVFAYAVVSDTQWLKWGAGGAAIIALLIAAIVELIKEATGQPEAASERVARFFVEKL